MNNINDHSHFSRPRVYKKTLGDTGEQKKKERYKHKLTEQMRRIRNNSTVQVYADMQSKKGTNKQKSYE